MLYREWVGMCSVLKVATQAIGTVPPKNNGRKYSAKYVFCYVLYFLRQNTWCMGGQRVVLYGFVQTLVCLTSACVKTI